MCCHGKALEAPLRDGGADENRPSLGARIKAARNTKGLMSEGLAKPLIYKCGTGILPVFHGRDAHATRGFARASSNYDPNKPLSP
jgi:hypothetical protein